MLEKTYKKAPLWTSINRVPNTYPWLYKNESAEVCILGGGFTGALTCLKFAAKGIDTVLLSADPIGFASTAKSCGLMQLHINKGLYSLVKEVGISKALSVYNMCKESIDVLENLCGAFSDSCGFRRTDSVLFTCKKDNRETLQKEYMLLKHNGFNVSFLNKEEALERFSFDVECAVILHDLAAIIDPYRFTHEAIKRAESLGARIYENSQVEAIGISNTIPYVNTIAGYKVSAETIISAIGLNTCEFFKDCGIKKTNFTVATKPIENFWGWENKSIINCIDSPNITFSITPDDRIIASGLNAGMVDTFRNISNYMHNISPVTKLENKKFDSLCEGLSYYFPGLCNTSPEYAFASDYIQTDSGLPTVGELEDFKNFLYALCPGDSSLVFSNIVSDLLLQMHKHGYENIDNIFG